MKKTVIALVLVSLICPVVSAEPSATDIITKAEVSTRGDTSYALYELTVKSRRGTRTLGIKVFDDRLRKRSMAEVTSPARDAGNRFLTMNDTMWHYVPNLQETVRISASMMLQPWMGSDFTNDDIVKSSSIIRDYTHTLLGREVVNGEQCYKLQLVPKTSAAVVWGKILYFARVSDCLPVKQEFYNEHNVLKKTMICSEFKRMGDRTIPTRFSMQSSSNNYEYSEMVIREVRFNLAIPEQYFTLQYLKRR